MSLKKNIASNYLGQAWRAVMSLAFLPVYIRYLGMESYGLIGLFAVLQACFTLLDMGMAPTLNRETARFTAGAHTPQSIRDLLRSIEVICFGISLLVGFSIWTAAPWLAQNWLQAEKLPVSAVANAISIMALLTALRFAEAIYRGAIMGLQRQVWFNGVTALFATLRAVGAIVVLVWVSPTIGAFFLWQGAVSLATVLVLGLAVHRWLPKAPVRARFSRTALAGVWRFAGDMMIITALSLLLIQVDKILLSRLLTLEAFGYYTFAATVAHAMYQLISPISQASYPQFTQLVTRVDTPGLVAAYHRGAQMVAVAVMPAAIMLLFFSENVIALWTGDEGLAVAVAPLVAVLALGTLLHGLMFIPYMLQLAHGWSNFAVRVNLVAVAIIVPALLWITPRYGAIGAAWVWVALNAAYVLIAIHFMHKRLLPREKWQWYSRDVAMPAVAAVSVAWLSMQLHPDSLTRLCDLAWLIASGAATFAATLIAAPRLRVHVIYVLRARRKRPLKP